MAAESLSPSERAAAVFARFDLSPSFTLDLDQLEARLREASLAWHPDRFALADPATREQAEDRMAAFNEAYRQLRSPERRAELLLTWLGCPPTRGTDPQASPAFLMQMMEWQEEAEEAVARAAEQPQAAGQAIARLRAEEDRLLHAFGTALAALPEELRHSAPHAEPLPEPLLDLRRRFDDYRFLHRTRVRMQERVRAAHSPTSP